MKALFLALRIIGIVLGLVLTVYGVFHQLNAEKVLNRVKDKGNGLQDMQPLSTMFTMTWIVQGAFISLCGLLPAILLLFHGISEQAVHTSLLLSGGALIFLAIHSWITNDKTSNPIIRVGGILELTYGTFLIILVIISYPFV